MRRSLLYATFFSYRLLLLLSILTVLMREIPYLNVDLMDGIPVCYCSLFFSLFEDLTLQR